VSWSMSCRAFVPLGKPTALLGDSQSLTVTGVAEEEGHSTTLLVSGISLEAISPAAVLGTF